MEASCSVRPTHINHPTSHAGLHSYIPSNLPTPWKAQVAQPGPEPTVALGKAGTGTASAWLLLGLSSSHVEPPQRSTPPERGRGRALWRQWAGRRERACARRVGSGGGAT